MTPTDLIAARERDGWKALCFKCNEGRREHTQKTLDALARAETAERKLATASGEKSEKV